MIYILMLQKIYICISQATQAIPWKCAINIMWKRKIEVDSIHNSLKKPFGWHVSGAYVMKL